MTNNAMVAEFISRFHQPFNEEMTGPLLTFRERLLIEEFEEVRVEITKTLGCIYSEGVASMECKAKLTKEMVDLLYVAYGFALTFGLPLQEAFERVHASNMSKLGEDGQPIYREDGKILKGPNYKEPNITGLFHQDKINDSFVEDYYPEVL